MDSGVKEGMENSPGPGNPRQRLALRLAGSALLVATGAIHLDLYLTGYRHIPTISWLFLLQVITAFALAAGTLAIRSPLVAAAGAGFAVTTLGGYLLALWVSLFGFQEVRTTAGIVAGLIEVAAFAVLAVLALTTWPVASRPQVLSAARPAMASRAVAGLAAVALVVLGVSVASAGGSGGTPATSQGSPGSGTVLVVIIKNFQFSPASPHVSPGQRIRVKNEDAVAHTLSAGPADRFTKFFNTGLIQPGQAKFIVAPKQPGAYPFFCQVHHFMTGMMVVGHSSASAAALTSFRAALRAHPPSYCGRQHAATATAAARRGPAGRLASGD